MAARIVLPRLVGFRLRGFEPIFKSSISVTFKGGPNLILGGSGLGKTTLVQAIVYGLTGGAEDAVEEDKALRWNHGYFRERLSATQVRSASVEVDFAFGKQMTFCVRRGFSGTDVLAFRDKHSIEGRAEAAAAFERALLRFGGYQSKDDFSLVIHRLLYLPETRRLIAWDPDTQVRLLMLVNQDVILEQDFRERRARLKMLDSRKRHIHVAIGKASEKLASLMEFDQDAHDDENENQGISSAKEQPSDLSSVVPHLQQAAKRRAAIEAEVNEAAGRLSEISSEVESLRERIESVEASLIARFLSIQEREQSLALHKLVESGICPACGTRQLEMQSQARSYAESHKCMLCGSDEPQGMSLDLATVRSQLLEKTRAQREIEDKLRVFTARLQQAQHEEEALQQNVNRIRFSEPIVSLGDQELPAATRDSLARQKADLERQEADLDAQMIELRRALEQEYIQFRRQVDGRISRLRQMYAQYATQFLGVECRLTESTAGDRLIDLPRFVPEFNGKARFTAHSCSEAQRFFLDIAFRMSLIHLASELSGGSATFICETPETALDLSYIDNVVRMFGLFSKNGHVIILTSNVQKDGIARKLLHLVPLRERASRLLNLLELGQLSDVHRKALRELRAEVKKAIT